MWISIRYQNEITKKQSKKTSEKGKTQQPTENQKNAEIQYKVNGAQCLHFAQHGGRFAPMNFRQLHDCCRLCCTFSLYKNRIAGFQGKQSCEIIFVACNMRCILHQSCPKKTQIVSPMRNPVFQAMTLYASSQTAGIQSAVSQTVNCGFRPNCKLWDN